MENSAGSYMSVSLKPHFRETEAVSHLSVTIVVGGIIGGLSGGLQGGSQGGRPSQLQNRVLFINESSVQDEIDNIGRLLLTAHIHDDQGKLAFRLEGNSWTVDRDTQGDVILQYDARPLADNASPVFPRILCTNHDGVVVIGKAFIPQPAVADSCDIAVSWDLSQAPTNTRGISSLGEGNVTKTGRIDILLNSVFMVGKVNSFPPEKPDADLSATEGFCATYWLGDLPENLDCLKDFSSNMFPRLSAFFRDERGSYRAFLRKIPKGQRGTSLAASSLIDYDADTKNEHDWELVRLLNSSMIATWARLDPEDDETENEWFVKGISHLYSIYLPYRFGQRTPHYFRATLNRYLTAYYTNPLVSLSLDQIYTLGSSIWHAESAIAMRGCVYMNRMDCFTRRASVARSAGVARPIDEMMADISVRRRNGEKVQTKDWLRYLGEWIGDDAAEEHLQNMKAGTVMDLEDMKTSFGGIVPERQKVMEMGFDKHSMDSGIVRGVVKGSQAAQAGLQNGDAIMGTSRPELSEMQPNGKFRMKVNRLGEHLELEFEPRGDVDVQVWQSKSQS